MLRRLGLAQGEDKGRGRREARPEEGRERPAWAGLEEGGEVACAQGRRGGILNLRFKFEFENEI